MKRVLIVLLCMLLICASALADTVYILCQPDSFVNVRSFPKKGADVIGYAELGWEIETDGTKRNGFIKVSGYEGDAWIYAGYVTDTPVTIMTLDTQIISKGRVACRRAINGTRRKWLKNGKNVTVYAFSDDWAVTDYGFIKTDFLGVN